MSQLGVLLNVKSDIQISTFAIHTRITIFCYNINSLLSSLSVINSRNDMARKNESRGKKRKSPSYNIKLQTAPPTKRRMPPYNERENEQLDIHRRLRQTSQAPEMIGIEQANSPCEIGTTLVEAEIYPVPAESSLDTEDKDPI